jgi:hypothetical protein
MKTATRPIFDEFNEKSPFGKESQALRPSSMPIQKVKSGAVGLEIRKSRLMPHNSS